MIDPLAKLQGRFPTRELFEAFLQALDLDRLVLLTLRLDEHDRVSRVDYRVRGCRTVRTP